MSRTRAKGNIARRQIMAHYVDQGYDVAIVERTGKFIKEKDAFGIFDICAWKGEDVAFVQVTCNRPHKHEHYEIFSQTHTTAKILQFVKHDGNKWDIFMYSNGQRFVLQKKGSI